MAGKMLFLMYVISIGIALITAVILSKTIIKGANTSPLLMELPPYRKPTMNSIMVHMGSSASEFLKKVGGIIVIGSMVIWFLQTFPQEVPLSRDFAQEIAVIESQPETELSLLNISALNKEMASEIQKGSYLGQIGGVIQPVFAPLGFDLNSSIALMTGFVAKEVVVATYGVLYAQGDDVTEEDVSLQQAMSGTMSPVTALAFMVFALFYMPCFGTLAMFYKESGSLGWTGVSVGLSLGVAYFLAFSISSVGGMLI
jgi:ferrous iron transport protein B